MQRCNSELIALSACGKRTRLTSRNCGARAEESMARMEPDFVSRMTLYYDWSEVCADARRTSLWFSGDSDHVRGVELDAISDTDNPWFYVHVSYSAPYPTSPNRGSRFSKLAVIAST